MASYAELYDLRANSALRNKVAVACVVAAQAIAVEDAGTANHAKRLAWAKLVFEDPEREAVRMLSAVLAANATATPAQISGASDATIQGAVNNAVNVFAQ